MSKVQQLQANYSQQRNPRQVCAHKAPSFGGEKDQLIVNATVRHIKQKAFSIKDENGKISIRGAFGWAGEKVHALLADTAGEKQTQLLNALFTATLAPLMIWKNPFLKKDEDQKQYAAIRQPISAGITLTGGLAMTMFINDYVDRTINQGHISSLDGRIAPTKDYMEKMFHEEHGKELKKLDLGNKESLNKFLNEHNLGKIDVEIMESEPKTFIGRFFKNRTIKKAIIENYSEKINEQRKTLFTNLIGEHPSNIIVEQVKNDSIISVKRDGKMIEIGRNIPNLTTQAEINAYTKKNNIHNLSLADLMEKHFRFESYKDGALKGSIKDSSLKTLKEIKAMEFLRKMGLAGDKTSFLTSENGAKITSAVNEDALGEALNKLSNSKTAKGLEESFASGVIKDSAKAGRVVCKAGSRAAKLLDGGVSEETINLEQLIDRIRQKATEIKKQKEIDAGTIKTIDMVKVKAKAKEAELKDLLNKKVSEATKIIADKLGIADAKTKTTAGALDIAGNLVNNEIKNLDKFKNYKGFVGIGFNLIFTAITCYALNWVYPRFVERFFPELVHDKGAEIKKGGNK